MAQYNINNPMTIGAGQTPPAEMLHFRDPVDARRSMMGNRVPSAEYPDGYLGTIVSRRNDRMLNTLKNRLTERSYQRGVHKGERIDQGDYFWPEEFNPQSALQYEARGQKWTAHGGTPVERLAYGRDPSVQRDAARSLYSQYEVNNPHPTVNQDASPFRMQQFKRLRPRTAY